MATLNESNWPQLIFGLRNHARRDKHVRSRDKVASRIGAERLSEFWKQSDSQLWHWSNTSDMQRGRRRDPIPDCKSSMLSVKCQLTSSCCCHSFWSFGQQGEMPKMCSTPRSGIPQMDWCRRLEGPPQKCDSFLCLKPRRRISTARYASRSSSSSSIGWGCSAKL